MTIKITKDMWYDDRTIDIYLQQHGYDDELIERWGCCLSDEIHDDYVTFVEVANDLMKEIKCHLRFTACRDHDNDTLEWKCFEILQNGATSPDRPGQLYYEGFGWLHAEESDL